MLFVTIILNTRVAVKLSKLIALKFTILVVVINEEAFNIFVVKNGSISASQNWQEIIKLLFKHNFSIELVGILYRVLIENFTEDENCSFVDVSFFFIKQGHSALLMRVQILNNDIVRGRPP